MMNQKAGTCVVAPFAGAWIEITKWHVILGYIIVAPFAGAWIEIPGEWLVWDRYVCRSLRGSVD